VHHALLDLGEGQSPTFAIIERAGATNAWPLETWAADLLLPCQVGQAFDDSRDGAVRYFLERRSGPIGAALATSITLPYLYDVVDLYWENGNAPAWRLRIAPDFDSWRVERVQ
jgi:hypothetical protein